MLRKPDAMRCLTFKVNKKLHDLLTIAWCPYTHPNTSLVALCEQIPKNGTYLRHYAVYMAGVVYANMYCAQCHLGLEANITYLKTFFGCDEGRKPVQEVWSESSVEDFVEYLFSKCLVTFILDESLSVDQERLRCEPYRWCRTYTQEKSCNNLTPTDPVYSISLPCKQCLQYPNLVLNKCYSNMAVGQIVFNFMVLFDLSGKFEQTFLDTER